MSTKEKHEYPFLIDAVELLDESKYTPGQLIAYDKYLDSIMSWNTSMAYNYDNGFDEGMEKGIEKGKSEGSNQILQALRELKAGIKNEQEIALECNLPSEKVKELKDLL